MRKLSLSILTGLVILFAAHSEAHPRTPSRIVSTAPSLTETLFALGAGDRVVGVTSYCRNPAEAREKTIIGDFASPSIETILGLRPDLVVVLTGRADLLDKLRPFSIPTLVLAHETFEEIVESLVILGRHIGKPGEAAVLAAQLRERERSLRGRYSEAPRPRILFVVSRGAGSLNEIYSVGGNSYIGRMLDLAGGENIFGSLTAAYPKVSVEEILARNPEIIIDLSQGAVTDPEEKRRIRDLWSRFPGLDAVRHQRVYVLDSDVFVIPGPRVMDAAAALAEIIHRNGF
jgi:iron complex transport system substrate-binding protein